MSARLPVVYLRGFAGGDVDEAVDDPFAGFNEGAVHVRVDGTGEPRFHQFEGPLLRLVVDEGYRLLVHGGQREYLERQADGSVPHATVWVHRFYDRSATTFGAAPEPFRLERAAEDLFAFVRLVLARTGAPRVHLVAHSMGGLVCRAMLQRTIPDDPEHGGSLDAGARFVERLFTYGTPHGGIAFAVGGGLLERARDLTGLLGADVFGPDRMHEYLTPQRVPGAPSRAAFRPEALPDGGFPRERVFCLVGTNADDYGAALGLSARAVGPRSDGLVQVDRAFVPGAHRAFVHRSHSGRYGLVNSEEGYQNLRRFLLGDLEVRADLCGVSVAGTEDDDLVWQLEVSLAIRGLPVLVHEQTSGHHCPVQVERQRLRDSPDTPVPLLTTFLSSTAPRPVDPATGAATPTLRHALKLRLVSLRQRRRFLDFEDHLEQMEDWQDVLLVDVAPDGARAGLRAWAAWGSQVPGAVRDWTPSPEHQLHDEDGAAAAPAAGWRSGVPLPPGARAVLGERARLRLSVLPRDVAAGESR